MLPDHEYHPLAVVAVVDETADTRSFVLDIPPALEPTFAYTAGQFCTFRATIEGESVVRSYSMSSSPDTDDPFTTTVKRVPGGHMSNWMNDALAPGAAIEVMRPTGLFVLRESDDPIVAFAGGSGITPVISIIKSALATTTRPIVFVYANRSADSVIFADELERLRSGAPARLAVHHHLDCRTGIPRSRAVRGVRHQAHGRRLLHLWPRPVHGHGRGRPVDARGRAEPGVHRTVRCSRGRRRSRPRRCIPESLVIRLERRKHTIAYHAGDTVLEAARRGGLRPPFSCEAGNCATCMAHLDKGSVTMRVNNALSASELDDGWVLTCQSIPTSAELVVNYDG